MRRHAKAIVAISATLLILALGATVAGAIAPAVTVDNAESVDYTTADAKGTVDPADRETFFHFEAATEADFSNASSTGFGALPAGGGSQPVGPAEFTGLKPGTTYHLRLVAENTDGEQSEAVAASTFTTDALPLPSVTIDPVSTFTDDGAHFSGEINPNAPGSAPYPDASDVAWHFECTPECPGLPGNQTIDADAVGHDVDVDVSGLDPNTSYEVRLIATNADGQQTASDETSFSTSTVAPIVETLPPAVVDYDSAWIGGKVNPQNSPATYYIELADNPAFTGSVQFPGSENGDAGSGDELVFVNHHASGLQPSTTYHYRVVATGAGATEGEPESFTTRAAPFAEQQGLPEGRVYEKVSPADKNGGTIDSGTRTSPGEALAKAAVQGDAVSYSSFSTFGGEGGTTANPYVARRTPSGWVSEGIVPRMDPVVGVSVTSVPWLSDDLDKALLSVPAALNPGDPVPTTYNTKNLYLREENPVRYRTLLGTIEPANRYFVASGVSADEEHVVFAQNAGGGSGAALWIWHDGVSQLVSVLPEDQEVDDASLGSGTTTSFPGQNAVSDDGSRVYFYRANTPGLWVREPGASVTTLVSSSERAGDDPEFPRPGRFELASRDGMTAFFVGGEPLTEDSASGQNLYRWDADLPPGERLTDLTSQAGGEDAGVLGTVGANDDATVVYLVATGRLTPEAKAGPALYEWSEGGGMRFIAGLNAQDDSVWTDSLELGGYRQAQVAADGRYLLFSSRELLTSYDTNETIQNYLWDRATGQLQCISCGWAQRSHAASRLSALTSSSLAEGAFGPANAFGYIPRNFANEGERIVFDSLDALVPTDSNGKIDVYQWSRDGLSLLSSGESGDHSRLLDMSVDGKDVFFTTTQKLVLSDKDFARDLYDARVGGVSEPISRPPCVADECQGTPNQPPLFVSPSSSTFKGDNSQVTQRKQRCVRAGRKAKQLAKGSKRGKRCQVKRKPGTRRGGRR